MKKFKKFVVCSDVHGDMQDPEAVRAIHKFNRAFRPEIRIINGDLFDFRNLRRGASDDEKAESLELDWKMGEEFATKFFAGGTRNVFLRGNHDERLWMFRDSATGVLRDYAQLGIDRLKESCREWGAKMLPYDAALGIYKLGKLSVLHGYHAGINATQMHARIYGNSIFGHIHTIESSPVSSLLPAEARSIGCMCIRDMGYINAKTGKLRWAQGWAYGLLFEDGTYTLWQARKVAGKFVCATDFQVF